MKRGKLLSELSNELNLHVEGRDVLVDGLNLCNRNTGFCHILSYVSNDNYIDIVRDNKRIDVLVVKSDDVDKYSKRTIERELSYIISEEPEKTFYDIHEYLVKKGFYSNNSSKTICGNNCFIDKSAVIQDGVIIGNNVRIGANTVIRSGSIIDDNVEIGCNSTIGSEGFQLIRLENNQTMHITHVGGCHISSNVYIGDNTCICNSLFEGATFIGEGTKIDNLVHVGHNSYIGKNVVITACVILCGSSIVEDNAWLAPNVSVLNKVKVAKGSTIGLGSVVTRNTNENSLAYGNPAKMKQI